MDFGIRSNPPCGDCWPDGHCSMNCGPAVPPPGAIGRRVGYTVYAPLEVEVDPCRNGKARIDIGGTMDH